MLCTQEQNPHAARDKSSQKGIYFSALYSTVSAETKQQLLQRNRKQAARQVRLEMNLSQQIMNVSLRNRLTEPYFLIIASLLCINVAIFHPPAVHFKKPNYFFCLPSCVEDFFLEEAPRLQRIPCASSQAALCSYDILSSRVGANYMLHEWKWTQSHFRAEILSHPQFSHQVNTLY